MPDIGDTLAHYTLEALLGQGGMGSVYQALDHKLQRRVALKVLTGDQDASARVLREARAAAALDHPNVVVLHEVGEAQGACYIAMELVQGRTLREAMADPAYPREARLRWLDEIARALDAAHRRGIVHRDLKPENVMIREDGSVKLLDFGIAQRRPVAEADPTGPTHRVTSGTLTGKGLLLGTPFYMAPEQLRGGPIDGRVDQFAWAVLAHEVLTGALPWRGGDDLLAVLASVLTDPVDEEPLRAAGLPAPLRAALLRALAKDPDRRFPSMKALLDALDAPVTTAPPPSAPPRRAPAAPLARSARYSTGELRAILARAIERQAESDQRQKHYSFDELLEAAREVGVDDQILQEASRELHQSGAPPAAPDGGYLLWLKRRRRGFVRHLGAYAMVNLALITFGLLVGSVFPMSIPGIFWAIGLGIHGIHVFTSDEDEWREKQQRKGRRRAPRPPPSVEEGATLLLQTSEARRLRVAPPRQLRVDPGTAPTLGEDEALALEEVAATPGAARRQR
jgi:serine/threonine-protein kinase